MANIGTFKQTKTGYEGTIATLSLSLKVKFIANDNKKIMIAPTISSNQAAATSA